MKQKLSLCMITKNNDPSERENLPKLFASIKDYVDEICVTVTYEKGTNPDKEYISWLEGQGCKLSTFEWYDDFTAARKHSFLQAENELVYWMDSDDIMINGEEIPGLAQLFDNNKKLTAIWINYAYDFDEDGNVAMWVPRERIVRKSIYRWVGALHENLICDYLPMVSVVPKETCHIKHNIDHKEVGEKAMRNLRIIHNVYKEEKQDGKSDPRTIYDLGRSLHSLRRFEEAEEIFLEFIGATDATSDMYDSYCRLSDIAKAQGSMNTARDYAMQAIKLKHSWPDGYHALAYVSFIEERWTECLHWLGIANQCEPPKGLLPHDPTKYEIRPLALAQDCYFRMNRPKEALAFAKKALKKAPSSVALKSSVKMIESFLHDQEIEISFVTVLGELKQTKNEEKIKGMLKCVPDSMRDHPFIVKMIDEYFPRDKVKNRIVIYCHEQFEAWSPLSVKTGIGGSEEAVINISKKLVNLGWSVDVYCDCNAPGVHDGVNWKQFYEYNTDQSCEVFIAWRMNEYINLAPDESLKILWLHDKQKQDYYSEEILGKIDKIFCLSKYHRDDLIDVPNEKFFITRNGIDPYHFFRKGPDGEVNGLRAESDPNKYIYASSPDRGLEKVFEEWPKIKKMNPKAELHVFYGFNKVYDKIQEQDPRRKEYKEKILALANSLPDIHWHGRVGHEDLAQWFLKCGFWLYPCTFEEISCITAMKAQASGCWPICTDYAALAETVQHGTITKGDVNDSAVLEEWSSSVVRALKEATTDRRTKMRYWAMKHFAWDTLANEWSDNFTKWKSEKKAGVS